MKSIFKTILNVFPRPMLIRMSCLVKPLTMWALKGDRYTDPLDGRSF
ncbi:MAG: SAM-dependent methyltransferase, partial [Flavobacteriaceae bacterium]|nr:SAM-dependent methyltransferase [Flavobacteriaceae bacterium]